MIIVNQDLTTQTITCIPEKIIQPFYGYGLLVVDEQTGVNHYYSVNNVNNNSFDLFKFESDIDCLYEGGFYTLKLYTIIGIESPNGVDNILYFDRLFSTNQNLDLYTVNQSIVTANTNNNDYIIT